MALLFTLGILFQGVQAAQLTAVSAGDLRIYRVDARNVSASGFEVDIVINETAERLQPQVVVAYTTDPYFQVTHQNITGGRLAVKTHRLASLRRTGMDGELRTYTATVANANSSETYYVYVMLMYENVRSGIEGYILSTRREAQRPLPANAPETVPVPWPSLTPTPAPTATPAPTLAPTPTPMPFLTPPPLTVEVSLDGTPLPALNPKGEAILSVLALSQVNENVTLSPAALTASHSALITLKTAEGADVKIEHRGPNQSPGAISKTLPYTFTSSSSFNLWIMITTDGRPWYYRVRVVIEGDEDIEIEVKI
jgi:hypothetical protein